MVQILYKTYVRHALEIKPAETENPEGRPALQNKSVCIIVISIVTLNLIRSLHYLRAHSIIMTIIILLFQTKYNS